MAGWNAVERAAGRGAYTIAVTNKGPDAAGDAVLYDYLPTNVTFGSLTGTAYVGRNATEFFFALKVNDPNGPGDSDVFFDNNDDWHTPVFRARYYRHRRKTLQRLEQE